MAKWCAMTNGERQNHIAWCFKECTDFTDYIDYDQYFSCLKDAQYNWYNALTIPVRLFECDEHAVCVVCCTWSISWRKYKAQRNNTVLLGMVIILDSHLKSIARHIPVQLKCHFVVEDAESSIEVILFFVLTIVTGLIGQTAGTVIVKEGHQRPMELLHY